jgi:hypothetical protein
MLQIRKSIIASLAVSALIIGISGCSDKKGSVEEAGKTVDQTLDNAGKNIKAGVEKVGEKVEQAGKNIKEEVKKDSGK